MSDYMNIGDVPKWNYGDNNMEYEIFMVYENENYVGQTYRSMIKNISFTRKELTYEINQLFKLNQDYFCDFENESEIVKFREYYLNLLIVKMSLTKKYPYQSHFQDFLYEYFEMTKDNYKSHDYDEDYTIQNKPRELCATSLFEEWGDQIVGYKECE